MKHDWEDLVDYGPARVHWCARCGRVVINELGGGEEGDWEYQVNSIKRQPPGSVPCNERAGVTGKET